MRDEPTRFGRSRLELQNGIRCLFLQVPGPEFYTSVHVCCGMDLETPRTREHAHFLEHMMAAFTSVAHPDAAANNAFLQERGVHTNAMTSAKSTVYFLRAPVAHAAEVCPLFLHAMTDAFRADTAIFAQEKEAVVQELHGYMDDAMYEDDMHELTERYGPDHPRSQRYEAALERVKHTTLQDLAAFRAAWYVPHRMCWIIAGPLHALPVCSCLSILENGFRRSAVAASLPPVAAYPAPAPPNPEVRCHKRSNATVTTKRIRVIFRVPLTASDQEACLGMQLLQTLLSGGMAARLYAALRTELGLVYNVTCDLEVDPLQPELSAFEIETNCACTHADDTRELLTRMRDELLRPLDMEEHAQLAQLVAHETATHLAYTVQPQAVAAWYASDYAWHIPLASPTELRRILYERVLADNLRSVQDHLRNAATYIFVVAPQPPPADADAT